MIWFLWNLNCDKSCESKLVCGLSMHHFDSNASDAFFSFFYLWHDHEFNFKSCSYSYLEIIVCNPFVPILEVKKHPQNFQIFHNASYKKLTSMPCAKPLGVHQYLYNLWMNTLQTISWKSTGMHLDTDIAQMVLCLARLHINDIKD
jgi:hypothetical protein